MNFEERLKAQKIIIAIALILISLVSFNFAVKGTYTIIAFLLGLAFFREGVFCLIWLEKERLRRVEAKDPKALASRREKEINNFRAWN